MVKNRSWFIFILLLFLAVLLSSFDLTLGSSFRLDESDITSRAGYIKGGLIVLPTIILTLILLLLSRYGKSKRYEVGGTNNVLGILVANKAWIINLALFYIFGLFSSLWSRFSFYSFTRAIFGLIGTMTGITTILTVSFIFGNGYKRVTVKIMYYSFLFLLTIFLAIYYKEPQIARTYLGRMGGSVIHPNTLGLLAGILIILAYYMQKEGFILWAIVGVSIGLFILVETGSRSGILGLFLMMYLHLLLKLVGKVHSVSVAVIIVSLTLVFLVSDYFIQFISLFVRDDMSEFSNLTNRTYFWLLLSSNRTLSEWIFGSGYGMVADRGYLFFGIRETLHAHNGYLQVLFGTGIIGFILFIPFVYKVILLSIAHFRKAPSNEHLVLTLLTIYILINNVTESGFGGQLFPQYIVLVMCLIALNSSAKQCSEIEDNTNLRPSISRIVR